jgi:aconitate hydratase
VIRHADGTTDTLLLSHSFGASQLDWFRAGSALNVVRRG